MAQPNLYQSKTCGPAGPRASLRRKRSCNGPSRLSAPTWSAACCAPRRSSRRARKREKGAISAAQLKEVEDREIEKIIKKQEEIGLKLATDGEFRRSWWHFDFFSMLDGVELYELDHGIQFQGVQTKMQSIRVKGKIGFSNHPMIEHFKFLEGAHQGDAEDEHPGAEP